MGLEEDCDEGYRLRTEQKEQQFDVTQHEGEVSMGFMWQWIG